MPKGPRTTEVSRRLVDAYVTSLRQHLPTYCIRQLDKLPRAQEHQLTRLRQSYPGTPTELLCLLQRVNGTCWEMLQAPPGSVPPSAAAPQPHSTSASASVETTTGKGGNVMPPTLTAPTAAAGSAEAGASPVSASEGVAAKRTAKATAAAAMASEAAAFIKSQIAKRVGTIARPRQRRPLPHFVALPILGSTYKSCPYYLKSVEQMLMVDQQFPPPPATLPDESEGWPPSPTAAATPSSLPPSPSTPKTSSSSATSSGRGGARDAAFVKTQCSGEGIAAGAARGSSPSAASSSTPSAHSIASVYAGYKIVYGAPPPSLTPSPSTGSASNAEASHGAPADDAKTSFTTSPTPTPPNEEPRVVHVDPRIDVHASFHQWLVFADSMQPHVRASTPIIPDDPAKMTAAAETRDAADSSRRSPARASAHTHTRPPKHFAASRLYIDFMPVELHGGVYGQVIEFVHGNPDSFSVIANDFGEYLKYIMTEEYGFTEELEDDDNDEGARVREENYDKPPLKETTPPIITSTGGRPLTSPTASLADVRKKV
ncbi:hypothetical protein, unknown function [Leishmania tarentolae]|uniref:Knr4/Smi1-like domain-containing protein n=1 Tax=Leishmania tarentolae TaxID=5689 RepID=A0A640KHL5_LEITA|nr:hypothetical protein, unknown function [Leishmania tarentolae]